MTCQHPVFRELLSERTVSGELVTAICAACLHRFAIVGAEHCARTERPRPRIHTLDRVGFVAPIGEAIDPAGQWSSWLEGTDSADQHPLCAEATP